MKTLIAYTSKYGSTVECASKLSKVLGGQVTIHDLRKAPLTDISGFDVIVIGSPVYVGKVGREVIAFCTSNAETLSRKTLGLFILGIMKDGISELNLAFPKGMADKAKAKAAFGGRLDFDRLNLPDRLVTKMISKVDPTIPALKAGMSHSTISDSAIREFAAALRE